ncbi:MAG: hypothetical protein Q7U04_11465 [Bacteriovorax sp.]|nr:hypothetical protein [Bacteriovorax sp.]
MTFLNNTKNSTLEIAFESIDSCFGYIDYISSRIEKLIGFYNAGELDSANLTFIEVIDLMDLYIQLISKVYRVIRVDLQGQSFKDESIQKLEIHLLSVLKALLSAKEKEDVIMLCDLLEYELLDNLTQWKIKVLPELKKLKSF